MIDPADQSELSRLFSGTSAGHCLTCGSEYKEVTCSECRGKGRVFVLGYSERGYLEVKSRPTCPTCQGRGVRAVCSGGCGEVGK